jgi:uncharacterized membrane protein required for colicin V production
MVALDVLIGFWLALATLLGLLRGVRAGLLALAGTLLAALLVDLWAEPLAGWVRATFRPELPGAPTFAALAVVFVLTAGLLGYGGAALLPRAGAGAAAPGLPQRLLGALLGALNGALLAGYLLRYAVAIWGDGAAAGPAFGSQVAGLLLQWLPWYVLGMVVGTGVLVLVRLGRDLAARSGQRRASSAPRSASVAAAPSLAEADRRLSDKIDQAIKK